MWITGVRVIRRMWEVVSADAEGNTIAGYLDEGWEPFCVTLGPGADVATVWLRKRVRA